jgi:3',5'-cyclic AMP phosphodiesterase CpdA
MRTIAHLSDLHFGRVDAALLLPLTNFLESTQPDLLVVSGDLTQRAKTAEFIAVRSFLDTLDMPKIIVPGNHDIPLHNVYNRFFKPLAKYQRYITTDMEPFHADEEIAVLGINTARSMTFKDGRINRLQIDRVRARLGGVAGSVVKILVTHHPFDLPPHMGSDDLVGSAPFALTQFAKCGVDLLLAGHMHSSQAVTTADRYKVGRYAALAIQAGTATSTRGRGESNAFNILRVTSGRVEVDRVRWFPESGVFEKAEMQAFSETADGWVHAPH